MKKVLDKIDRWTYFAIELFCQFILLVMVLSVSYAVFARIIFNNPPSWGEEIGVFCMVWVAFISSTLAIRDGRHIRITIVSMILPEKGKTALLLISYLVIVIIGVMMMKYGYDMSVLAKMNILPSTRISRAFITSSVPITGFLTVIMFIGKVREILWTSTQ